MRTLALLTAALFATSLSAAPVPKEKEKVLYFPVQVGTKRVKETKVGQSVTHETTEEVTKAEEKDGVYTLTVESKAGEDKPRESFLQVSDKGVFRLPTGGRKVDPRPVLKLPAKEGETWEAETLGPLGKPAKHTSTTGKEEEVEVPAGKFKAVRVDVEVASATGTAKMSFWYARGVGTVKVEIEQASGLKSSEVLKSFTPAKEEKTDEKKKEEPKKDK